MFSSFAHPSRFDLQPPSSRRYLDEAGPSTDYFIRRHRFREHRSVGGSFTQLLQSDLHEFMAHMRPPFNRSHIPYPENYQTPVYDSGTRDSGPSTQVAEDPPEGDDDQVHRRRRRTVRHSRCGTGGYWHHH
ncbi:alanine--glyoxylate aminotransferase 21, mitochondrial [Dorcoceras hygrometricum]|uniref:Alanine--glyoxylate aminotransferase 21, mitochondrial n=1 Tax=Dorcoceras hygrometricum TaxID=472368 RepID=A0A2Z7BPV7_9LAMI|nr:alanine--glyoxylate aminotransferase 21, mitochondrial [Dorcoceras hygrometricum]